LINDFQSSPNYLFMDLNHPPQISILLFITHFFLTLMYLSILSSLIHALMSKLNTIWYWQLILSETHLWRERMRNTYFLCYWQNRFLSLEYLCQYKLVKTLTEVEQMNFAEFTQFFAKLDLVTYNMSRCLLYLLRLSDFTW
jgi:hypothetical protein